MRVRDFDRDFAEEIIRRLKALPPDRKPKWGKMPATDLVPHLTQTVLFSIGRRNKGEFKGNFITRYLVGPLVLSGWLPLLKNVNLGPAAAPDSTGYTLEDLQAALNDYLSAVELGALRPEIHPLFGDIGVDGWASMHARHFEHHFDQFNL